MIDLKDIRGETKPVKLSENSFMNSEDGSLVMPSLMTLDQERTFKIAYDWFIKGKSRNESLRIIREFDMADDYRKIYLSLGQTEEFILKFIAEFKSVQKLHLIREASLFPEIMSDLSISKSLNKLFLNNLIWKWKYVHPVYGKPIEVYTLSTNGYYMLKLLANKENYFFPGLFLSRKIPPVFHVRFWETADLYQLFVSLPSYRGSTTLFSGGLDEERIVNSPLQIAVQLSQDELYNLIIYPVLQTDGDSYYNHVIERWLKFTNQGKNLQKDVNGLPGTRNVLTFYAPTGEFADQFNKHFQMNSAPFPVFYLLGSMIRQLGIENAFYAPAQTSEIDTPIQQVKHIQLLGEVDLNE